MTFDDSCAFDDVDLFTETLVLIRPPTVLFLVVVRYALDGFCFSWIVDA